MIPQYLTIDNYIYLYINLFSVNSNVCLTQRFFTQGIQFQDLQCTVELRAASQNQSCTAGGILNFS